MEKRDKVCIFWGLFSLAIAILISCNNGNKIPDEGMDMYLWYSQVFIFSFRTVQFLSRRGLI